MNLHFPNPQSVQERGTKGPCNCSAYIISHQPIIYYLLCQGCGHSTNKTILILQEIKKLAIITLHCSREEAGGVEDGASTVSQGKAWGTASPLGIREFLKMFELGILAYGPG